MDKIDGNSIIVSTGYGFTPEAAFEAISRQWKEWSEKTGLGKFVVGISGGIDSTCVAALACRVFGTESVVGVSLPCDGQKDMRDVDWVFEHLGIRRVTIDIGDAFHSIVDGVENSAIEPSAATKTNLPARLRMSALYAVAQSLPGFTVANTCNLSEDICGWNTFGGDNLGSYAPVRWLTKTEVRALAAWLGVPGELVSKTPVDGLQAKTDEEAFGFSYADLDDYIRTGNKAFAHAEKATQMYQRNKFKLDIVDIPGPAMPYPNYVAGKQAWQSR